VRARTPVRLLSVVVATPSLTYNATPTPPRRGRGPRVPPRRRGQPGPRAVEAGAPRVLPPNGHRVAPPTARRTVEVDW